MTFAPYPALLTETWRLEFHSANKTNKQTYNTEGCTFRVMVKLNNACPPCKQYSRLRMRLNRAILAANYMQPVWYENLSRVVSCPENSNINTDGLDSVVIGSHDQ